MEPSESDKALPGLRRARPCYRPDSPVPPLEFVLPQRLLKMVFDVPEAVGAEEGPDP